MGKYFGQVGEFFPPPSYSRAESPFAPYSFFCSANAARFKINLGENGVFQNNYAAVKFRTSQNDFSVCFNSTQNPPARGGAL